MVIQIINSKELLESFLSDQSSIKLEMIFMKHYAPNPLLIKKVTGHV